MSTISLKKGNYTYDQVSLGEVMLRLDPGHERIKTTRQFKVWEGGGEYNVARGLRRCFKQKTAIITAVVENDIGYLLEDLILQGGVNMDHVKWVPFDGSGRRVRQGLNFTERGFGIRSALGVSDRGHTAVSQLKPGDIDWDHLFGTLGARWFHTGGIFAALGEHTPEVVIEALQSAKKHGTITSYDLNYRPSLWKDIGGTERAQQINKKIAQYVDVMLGNEEDFTACLGFEVENTGNDFSTLDSSSYENMIQQVVSAYPSIKAVATTLRNAKTASINDWGAVLYYNGEFCRAPMRENLEIFDRVGGGDSFASGLIYGFLSGKTPQEAVEYGAAHGAFAMTTPGDTTTAALKEIEKVLKGGGARVDR